jgi:large subunit ribosomal protein L10
MSKQIKQMEMDALKETFGDVRDMVVLSASKLDCQSDHAIRSVLRKKNIRLKIVKNSLARRVFDDLGIKTDGFWEGPTALAWGSSSLADLSKELHALGKKYEKQIKFKAALAEGQPVTFQAALRMPTRAEAAGRIVSLAMSPASRLISQILGPAAQIAGQIKSIAGKVTADAGAEPAGTAPPG